METYGQTSGEQTPPQTQHSHPPPKPPKVESRQDTENNTRGGHRNIMREKERKDIEEEKRGDTFKKKERKTGNKKKEKGRTRIDQWKKEIRRIRKKKDEGTTAMSPLFGVAMHGMFSPSFVKGVTPLKTGKRRMKIMSKRRSHRKEGGGEEKTHTGSSRGSIIMNTRITWIHHTFVKWQSHPRYKAIGRREGRNTNTRIRKKKTRRRTVKGKKTRSAGIFRNERANRNKHENEPAGEGAEGGVIGEKNSTGAGAPRMKRMHEHRAGGADSTVPRKECHESDNRVNSPRETDDRGGDRNKELEKYKKGTGK